MANFLRISGAACLIIALLAGFADAQGRGGGKGKGKGKGRGENVPEWGRRGGRNGGGNGSGGGGRRTPPEQAYPACASKANNDACAFTSPRGSNVTGTCRGRSRLHCVPQRGRGGGGGGGGGGGRPGQTQEQRLREQEIRHQRTRSNSSLTACEGVQAEASCIYRPPVHRGKGKGKGKGKGRGPERAGRSEREGICVPMERDGEVVNFCRSVPPQAAMDACENSQENDTCSFQRNGTNTTITLQVSTCQKDMAETAGTVLASFYIPSSGEWTDEEVFFADGAKLGEVKTQDFTLPGRPDRVTLTIWSNDAWCFWKVAHKNARNPSGRFNTALEDPSGPSGSDAYSVDNATSSFSTSLYWLEGPPSSQIFDVPVTMSDAQAATVAPQTVNLHIFTGESEHAATTGSVFVSFLVNSAWTAQELMFTGAKAGEEKMKSFTLESWPIKVWIGTTSSDPYGYWKVTINQLPVAEDPSSSEGWQNFNFDGMEKYFEEGIQFWISAPPSSQTVMLESAPDAPQGPQGPNRMAQRGTCQPVWWDMLSGMLHCRPESRRQRLEGRDRDGPRANSVEPNWNVKSVLEDSDQPESVDLTFTVKNIAYSKLNADAVLMRAFTQSIKETVAAAAGQGVYARHVTVNLSPGSVVVDAKINAPDYVSRANVRKLVGTTNDLPSMVTKSVSSINGIAAVSEGPISVSAVNVKPSSKTVSSTKKKKKDDNTVLIIALSAASVVALCMCMVSLCLFKKLRAKTASPETVINGTTIAVGRPVAAGGAEDNAVEGITVNQATGAVTGGKKLDP